MSIRLLQAVFLSGVYTAVDGATLSLSPGLEAELVGSGRAAWVVGPKPSRSYAHEEAHQNMGAQYVLRFPDFVKSLLASLVATTTVASRAAGVVTVSTAPTGHGITTGAAYIGFNFFYPGSPSLTAGWYGPIMSVPDANTITFAATGPNFSSEPVNGGAAYTTLTAITSLTIPANFVRPGAILTSRFLRVGDTSGTTKNIRNVFGTRQIGLSSVTTLPMAWHRLSILCDEANGYGIAAQDGASANTFASGIIDFATEQTFSLSGSLSAASSFLALYAADLEISNG